MVKRNNLVTRAFCLQGGKSGWKMNEDDPDIGRSRDTQNFWVFLIRYFVVSDFMFTFYLADIRDLKGH